MVGETVQVNFRWPKELVEDLAFVAKNLKVQKGDWVRMTLSKTLTIEKDNLEAHIIRRYVKGYISEEEFIEKMGHPPEKHLKDIRNRNLENVPSPAKSLKATRKYMLESIGLNPDDVKETEEPLMYFTCPHCLKESEIPISGDYFKEIIKNKKITCPECKMSFDL